MLIEKINNSLVFRNGINVNVYPINTIMLISNDGSKSVNVRLKASRKNVVTFNYDEVANIPSSSANDLVDKINALQNGFADYPYYNKLTFTWSGDECKYSYNWSIYYATKDNSIDNGDGTYTYTRNFTEDEMKYFDYRSTFDTSYNLISIIDIPMLGVEGSKNSWWMFQSCFNLESADLSKMTTSEITNMQNMFIRCINLKELNLSNWDTSNVTSYSNMFYYCESLEKIYVNNCSQSTVQFIQDRLTEVGYGYTYDGDEGIITVSAVPNDNFLAFSWDKTNATSVTYRINGTEYSGSSNPVMQLLSSLGIDTITDVSHMFNSSTITELFSIPNTSNVTNMSYMFSQCRSLTSLDVSNFDTSNVTDMSSMFGSCSGLTSLDLSNFDTSNVTTMSCMFQYCSGLTELDLSSFNTSACTNMEIMFFGCTNLTTLNLSNWDTSNVTSYTFMFYNCNFETVYVKNCSQTTIDFISARLTDANMTMAYDSNEMKFYRV